MAILELTFLLIPIFIKGNLPENLMKYGCCYFLYMVFWHASLGTWISMFFDPTSLKAWHPADTSMCVARGGCELTLGTCEMCGRRSLVLTSTSCFRSWHICPQQTLPCDPGVPLIPELWLPGLPFLHTPNFPSPPAMHCTSHSCHHQCTNGNTTVYPVNKLEFCIST